MSWKYKKAKFNTISDINFKINTGSFHAFIGENGAGKSTTIKVIIGLVSNYEGNVIVDNINLKENANNQVSISYIPDKAIFPTEFSCKQYLMQMGKLVREDVDYLSREIDNLLEELEISEVSKKNPNKLSAGQKKKILLIKAIIEKASTIVLDEPAANLDPTTRIIFFNYLKKLSNNGVTVFISTHIIEEIKKYATHATFIKKGKILWSGKVEGEKIIKIYNKFYLKGL